MPVPVGVSAPPLEEWERWRETADRVVAETYLGVAGVEITVDTLFRAIVEREDYDDMSRHMHFVTTVYPTNQHVTDLPDKIDDQFYVDTAMERRIAVVQQLVGAPAEGMVEGRFSLFAIEMGAPTWDAAEGNHQQVVDVILAVVQDRGVAIPGGPDTHWTRADRR